MKLYRHTCKNCGLVFKTTGHRGDWCNKSECMDAKREHWLSYGRQYDRTYKRKVSAAKKANLGKKNTKKRRYCQNCGALLKNRYFNCLECAAVLERSVAGDDWIYYFPTRKPPSEWKIIPVGVANNTFKEPL